ncbi:ferredoxin family protein [Saccharicrinis sp. FJH62]|uniref:4Fe-4S dicluster domain-containing protein n=1 Tax=Saccharicrinis sp. FJH62 TaxID=3344657 RepID=UPI0035D3F8CC
MSNMRLDLIPEMPVAKPIIINEDLCIGCKKCMEICQVDIFVPNPDTLKKAPLVLYPGECWYCGNCVVVCPVEGAIKLQHPLMNRVHWIEKEKLGKHK